MKELAQTVNETKALIRSYHECITKEDLVKFVESKITDIYFDHACWKKGECENCVYDWVKEL